MLIYSSGSIFFLLIKSTDKPPASSFGRDGLLNLVSMVRNSGESISMSMQQHLESQLVSLCSCSLGHFSFTTQEIKIQKGMTRPRLQGRNRNRKWRWQGTSPFPRNRAKYLFILQLSLMYLLHCKIKVKCPFNSSSLFAFSEFGRKDSFV